MVPFFNFHPWSQIQLLSFSPLLCSCCSVATPCSTLCDPMDYSEPGASVLCCLPEFAQIHVHWVGDAIQPSHPLLTCSKLWWCGRINTQMFHSGHWWKTECKLFTFEKKKLSHTSPFLQNTVFEATSSECFEEGGRETDKDREILFLIEDYYPQTHQFGTEVFEWYSLKTFIPRWVLTEAVAAGTWTDHPSPWHKETTLSAPGILSLKSLV